MSSKWSRKGRGLLPARDGLRWARDLEAALSDFERAVELDEELTEVFSWLANYTTFPEHGLAYYDRAVEANPNNPLLYVQRGLAYEELGDLEAALADYERALRFENPEELYFYEDTLERIERLREELASP